MVCNEENYTQIDKCNLGDKEEEKEPQDIIYLVFKGALKELATEVQVIINQL